MSSSPAFLESVHVLLPGAGEGAGGRTDERRTPGAPH